MVSMRQSVDLTGGERVRKLVERAVGVPAAAVAAERRAGHASVRVYWRARWEEAGPPRRSRSAVVMLLPPDAPPDEIGKARPTGAAPFVAVEFARRAIFSHERPSLVDVEASTMAVSPRSA